MCILKENDIHEMKGQMLSEKNKCGKGRPSSTRKRKELNSTTRDPSQFEIVEASLRHKTQQGGCDYAQTNQIEGNILDVDLESMLCEESRSSKFLDLNAMPSLDDEFLWNLS
ncbi:hypothetical protein ACH5RR_013453 [Cinchona calisaya]|uniref:Uncharacterized protein n=1 Tax=Cinchona calisaya TaxID=153742 RepID=A0ABD3A034_9GENT